jgi:hypothetical protein
VADDPHAAPPEGSGPAGFHTADVFARHLGIGSAGLAELKARGII